MEHTIIIIDDEPEIVNSLRWLIETIGMKVISFHNGEEFLSEYTRYKEIAACIILDVRMKGMSGLKVQESLIKLENHIPIIFLTAHGDIQMATQAMKNGASDFFVKPFNNQQLLESVHAAIEKNDRIKQQICSIEQIKKNAKKLSSRELEVMKKIVQGKLNKVIAYELGISISTTETHRAKIMKKMEAATLADLVKLCIHAKICEVTDFQMT